MEDWSMQDDRPANLRPLQSSFPWITVALAVLITAAIAGYYYVFMREAPPAAPAVQPAKAPPVAQAPQPASPQPAVRYPLAQPPAAAVPPEPLPAVEDSDALMREQIAGLMGVKPFNDMVVPSELVRRIVATVDNLPRPTAPRRTMPLNPVPGRFATQGPPEETVIDTANHARYAPYVRVFESINSRALVFSYVRAYPLFQRAYEQLGYPGRYFNDRLIDAIDDLLAAPEIEAPLRVVRDKVLYAFENPTLESRSAGQKIMLRMGPDNARQVKAKLRELRQALVAATDRRQ